MTIAFPGYVPDVHTSDALDPAWGNAIRDRAPQVFTTLATLAAAVTSPQVGQSAVITTGTGLFTGQAAPGEYIYAGATDGWRPPWNNGWGEQVRTVDVTSPGLLADSAEHTIAAAATVFTAVANRLYRISVSGMWNNAAGANATLTIRVKDGTTLIEQARAVVVAPIDAPITFSVESGTLTAGAHTINITMQSSNVAGLTCKGALYPLVVTIDDIGPAGAPS